MDDETKACEVKDTGHVTGEVGCGPMSVCLQPRDRGHSAPRPALPTDIVFHGAHFGKYHVIGSGKGQSWENSALVSI